MTVSSNYSSIPDPQTAADEGKTAWLTDPTLADNKAAENEVPAHRAAENGAGHQGANSQGANSKGANSQGANSQGAGYQNADNRALPAENRPALAKENQAVVFSVQQQKTMMLSRRTGYALLLLCFIDLLYILIPPELLNPVWEYQTIGDLVKLVPVPLLAMMLIFYGDTALRSKPERLALSILSWMTLLIGIIFLLLIPLTITDAVRIRQFNDNQIDNQVSQQRLQLDATRKQLEKASPEAIRNLVPTPDQNGNLPDIPDSPEQAKKQILNNLNRAKEQADQQAEQARKNLRQNLFKNTLKLVLESLIAGCFFIYVWKMTSWTRRKDAYQYETARQSSLTALPRFLRSFGSRSRRRL